MKKFFRGKSAAILLLLVFGVGKLPLEKAATARANDLGIRGGDLNLELREQVGQMTLAAAFGGFRSLAASLISVAAFSDWRNVRWDDLEKKYRLVTQLQPRVDYYYYTAFTHLSYDANSFFKHDTVVESPVNPGKPITESERKYYSELYLDRGITFLEDGIRNNPKSADLHMAAGRLYQDPNRPRLNAAKAAEAYRQAYLSPHAPGFAERFHAYALSEVEGKEREAYAHLRELHQRGPEQRKPTLLMRILVLEEILKIPESDRLPLDKAQTYRTLKGYRPIRMTENPDAIKAVYLRLEEALGIPEDKRERW